MEQPYTIAEDGICLAVRVIPRAKKSEVAGIVTGVDGRTALSIRLAAPPVDGAANKALLAFLAGMLDVTKSAISIRSGETGRLKRIDVTGDPRQLAGIVAAL